MAECVLKDFLPFQWAIYIGGWCIHLKQFIEVSVVVWGLVKVAISEN
jgi:hypothetical protein